MKQKITYQDPPEWIMQALRWYCASSFLEEIEGDLYELFQEEIEEYGEKRARRRFFLTSLRYINPYFFGKKHFNPEIEYRMNLIQHYLKVGFRHLWKQRLYSLINIMGLAIGIACCITVLFYVIDETGYDTYHENVENLYRLSNDVIVPSNGQEFNNAVTPILWGPALKRDYPEVEDYARFIQEASQDNPWVVTHQNNSFAEAGILFTDPSALKMFSWPLIQGDVNTALSDPSSIVITQKIAKKYFNDANPIGKVLTIDPRIRDESGQLTNETYDLTVSAVMVDIPRKSHFTFDILLPSIVLSGIYGVDINGDGEENRWHWRGSTTYTYLKLANHSNPKDLEAEFPDFLERYLGDDTKSRGYYFQPLLQRINEIYLDGERNAQLQPVGNKNYLYIFSAIALFILLIACINYINLSTARAATRAREVGMRKMVGAQYKQLVGQFLGESILITVLSLLISVGLARIFLPVFYDYLDKEFLVLLQESAPVIVGILAIGLLVGVIAGAYPSFFLARFRMVQVLKGSTLRSNKGAGLRKGLVVFQFVLSAILIMTTLTLYKQLTFMQSHELGFDKEQVLILPPQTSRSLIANYEPFKEQLLSQPAISDITISSGIPGYGIGGDLYGVKGGSADDAFSLREIFIDYNYIDFYKISLQAGRDFSRELEGNGNQILNEEGGRMVNAILNEEAVKRFGWSNPREALGKQIIRDPNAGDWIANIIGVVGDFHLASLQEEIEPVALIVRDIHQFISIKLQAGDPAQSISFIKAKVNEFAPETEFEYEFLDDSLASQYERETQIGKAFTQVSILAIFIACMGLFGLAAFMTEQRVKEIGVRKTLGASTSNIVMLLSKDITKLVLLAMLIAIPIAYFLTETGLENFAYRIGVSWEVYVIAVILALAIAILTISFHTVRAALSNPVHSLRSE